MTDKDPIRSLACTIAAAAASALFVRVISLLLLPFELSSGFSLCCIERQWMH